jgi:hypothetical protein
MKRSRIYPCLIAALMLLSAVSAAPAAAASVTAAPTTSAVLVDGQERKFEAFRINGNNYFRLRDVAYALRGTVKEFEVSYDASANLVVLTTNATYTVIGNEMAISGLTGSVAAEPAANEVRLDGARLSLTAYIIGETNYVKLRDIAAAVNFGVRYLGESDTIEIDTTVGYTPELPVMTFPSDLSVTVIGDSVTAGVAPYVKKYFPKAYIDAKACRQFSAAPGIIEGLLRDSRLSSTVVIQLGTNGRVRESDVYKVIELIGPDRKLVLVNCRVPRSWCEGDNKTFTKIAAEFDNIAIADWYGASHDKDNYFYKDGFHPNKKGCGVLAQVIAEAVAAIQPYKPYLPVSVSP